MPRILFAWELGSNLGHLTRDLPLARACRDAGHEVIFAVADLRIATDLLHGEHFRLIQAPLLRPIRKRTQPPVNFADMLLHQGYGDAVALVGALSGWRGLFEWIHPALMVYNHAPTALLAARMARLPVLMVGTGFEIPPAVTPMPSFRPWQEISHSMLHDADVLVLAHVNLHLTECGLTPLARLSDLFPPTEVQLATFAELDPFGPRPDVNYIGPIHALPQAPVVGWQGRAKHKIFAYLRPHIPGCSDLLSALQMLDVEVICVLPGLPKGWRAQFDRIRFLPRPVDLADLLPKADLVVTYSGGMIATALLTGVPVLLVPWVVEQFLAGLPLEKSGAGRMLRESRTPGHCLAMLRDLLNQSSYRLAARSFAYRHREFSHANALREQWLAVTLKLEAARGRT